MEAVAELILSALLEVLFEKLASADVLNYALQLQGGVHSKLKKWEKKFLMIKAVLKDAEDKHLNNTPVKIWLDNLQDLAYDVEDLLEEFAYEALRRKMVSENQTITNKARKLIPGYFTSLKFNANMVSKIDGLTSRLEDLYEERTDLGLQVISGGTSTTSAHQRLPSSSVATGRTVYGRDKDKKEILKMVLTDDADFRVISIVGMGGIGKTTLACEVYNDKAVGDFKFDIKAWTCVSDDFDVFRISKALLESITSSNSSPNNLNDVQVKLKEAVNGKKFLLVLDDVWNKKSDLWERLKSPFIAGAPGSKMIVTTRHKNVASTMGPLDLHHDLTFLSDDDCWSLFLQHAFEHRDMDAHQSSEFFKRKVVDKCKGLPLAARTLGGLLCSKTRNNEWVDILDSEIWDLTDDILPVLRLSYHHLPSHLKRCFVYCSVFPKDYEFNAKELVPLWMAEGLLQLSTSKKQPDDLGGEFFRDLSSRSIFQQSSSDSSKFVMHDLIHDLAQLTSGDRSFRLEDTTHVPKFERVHHASYICDYYERKDKFNFFHKFEDLRTFLPLGMDYDHCYITTMVVFDLLPKFKQLRALSLQNYWITQLPDSIGDLIHLRYLNFSKTKIKSLPESTSLLFNLQTLILRNCSRLMKLPSKMRYLTNLCHLDIQGENSLEEMPTGMKELKNLRVLSNFIVGKGTSSNLEELKNLSFLRGKLHISKLDNVVDPKYISGSILSNKEDLEKLFLEWKSQFDDSRKEDVEANTLDMLKPHKNLKELTIKFYGGSHFPPWLGDSSLLSNLVVLKLENCKNCTILPSLGIFSSLKDLTIKEIMRLGRIDFQMPFQSLEILRFENLPEWECWDTKRKNEDAPRFPLLRELSIVECPKLTGDLPDHLASLETLVISKCAELVIQLSSFPMLCRLEIDDCKEMYLPEGLKQNNLESLKIKGCDSLTFIAKGMFPSSLKSLEIQKCEKLQCLEDFSATLLEYLFISNCQSLTSISLNGRLPETLKELHVEKCDKLTTLSPRSQYLPKALENLSIRDCSKLESIIEKFGNDTCLKRIRLHDCGRLKSLPEGLHSLCCLEKISLWDCSSLISFPEGGFPNTISCVFIGYCEKLEVLPEHLQSLRELKLRDCPKISTALKLSNSLQKLYIWKCPILFSEEGIPTNLIDLKIGEDIKICKQLIEWGLHNLDSLRELTVDGCQDAEAFIQEDNRMPTSLTSLRINRFPKLKYLCSKDFQSLISLQSLAFSFLPELESIPDLGSLTSLNDLLIEDCLELKSIPELGSLTSLTQLRIRRCPKLKSFQSLPSSLLVLNIEGCPLLKKRCKRGKGKYWSKIAHIPCIEVDDVFIYLLEEED